MAKSQWVSYSVPTNLPSPITGEKFIPESNARYGAPSAMAGSSATPDRTALFAFAAFVVLSGGASIAIRFTYGELAPYWSGVLRFGAAALIY